MQSKPLSDIIYIELHLDLQMYYMYSFNAFLQ